MKSNNLVFLMAGVFLIGAIALINFAPDHPIYPHTYAGFLETSLYVEGYYSDYLDSLIEAEQLEKELLFQEQQIESMGRFYHGLLEDFKKPEWGFHPPSMLILLEQNARDCGTALTIKYNEIVYVTEENLVEDGKKDGGEMEEEGNLAGLLAMPGFDVALVPIEAEGEYAKVRNYFIFLEQTDLVCISKASLYALGDGKVRAEIDLLIFAPEGMEVG